MIDVLERTNYWLKNAWKLPLVWVWLGAIILSLSASISVMVRETVITHLERQITVAKEQIDMLEAQADVLKTQNLRSVEDRAYIHAEVDGNRKSAEHWGNEINSIRDALKRLEERK